MAENSLEPTPDIMTLPETAAYLKIAERTVYLWAQTGRIPGFKLGSAWRFRRSELDEWLESRRVGPVTPQRTDTCVICERPFGGTVRAAGTCDEPQCTESICQTCWGPRGRRKCPAHVPRRIVPRDSIRIDATSKAQSMATLSTPPAEEITGPAKLSTRNPTDPWDAVKVSASRILDGFQGRVEAEPNILTGDGRLAAEVRDWDKARYEEIPAPLTTRLASRRAQRPAVASRIGRTLVGYTVNLREGVLATRHQKLRLEARVTGEPSSLETQRGPVDLPHLTSLLTRLADGSRQRGVHTVAGIFSFTGWTDQSAELVVSTRAAERFLSPDLSPVLMGPGLDTVRWNQNDPVGSDLSHYFQATFEDEVASCRRRLTDILSESKVCLLRRLIEDEGFSAAAVRTAAGAMVKARKIELVTQGDERVAVRR